VRDLIGVKKVMSNNAFDDPTHIRQCVGHRLIKDAGVPYSRCNFARVRVNGVDLTSGFEASTGLYVNVEPIFSYALSRRRIHRRLRLADHLKTTLTTTERFS
jgi:hypothetical protein